MSRNCTILEKDTRLHFLEEMSLVQEAVAKGFTAEKMNIELLGNGDAHLHWHLFPRRRGDMNGHGLKDCGPVWWVPFEKMTAETRQAKPDEIRLPAKQNMV
ncbi:HIT family protein [Streptococcus pneumoniae]|nr:HIT family protein [Streptococcus pneumoniae]CVN19182.1 HIT family protein [Streptococcus pneumoniae]CVO69859.1 HIT family protein [Streptococcus pneumoniae]CVO94393.1 HIT family protein [Streptococcus pneumoniae]CVU39787.1 HIT family protein [Streptococcus pneumoniae]